MDLHPIFCAQRLYVEPAITLVDTLATDYKLSLRGKTLIQAIVNYLSDSRRAVKYSKAAVVDVCLRLFQQNPYIRRIITNTRAQLA
jgi:hypothetical protein